jgi:hypothetical protein
VTRAVVAVVAVVDVEPAGERADEVDRFTVRDGLIAAVEHIGDTEMPSGRRQHDAGFPEVIP